MVFDAVLPAVGAAASAIILAMIAGSSFRTMLAALSLQILLTAGQLASIKAAVGMPLLNPDEILLVWSAFLWMIALADGRASARRSGALGALIVVFSAIVAVSATRGAAAGYPMAGTITLAKTMLMYLVYFPALWLLGDDRRIEVLWKVLLVGSIVAGIVFFVKGLTGSGEGVQYLYASGLRIGSRQANAFAVVLLMLLARLWLSPSRPPLSLAVPVAMLMVACLVISSTRALWGGVVFAVAAAWMLGLFRRGGVPGGIGRHVRILTIAAVSAVVAITAVSALGIISTSQMASRVEGGGSYSLPIDIGLLSRLISWATILDGAGPSELLAGRGIGAEITYFKPEFGNVWTMSFIDGSFWQVLLDMGLIGVAGLGLIFSLALIQSARLFLTTPDIERASRAMGVFCSLILLLVASMMSSVLTNYNYVALWAVLLALLQSERNREADSTRGAGSLYDQRSTGPARTRSPETHNGGHE
ncbi:MAG TPA: hypothetical protein PLV86_00380 [Candidatus Fermentibacter daniensis]|jgi:hypothetical protein|nr:MAG: hypothetical protein AO396_05205 [Candidatus Fermentibacter daniensis]MBP7719887.1 hypothetical protein [Candidatus Fermentibacter sp.]MCC6871452.1 hypothetical protein [Candidatus Fermentibacter sp.]HOD19191.1 hypothetical protein [Candidatus Fermentibacter daniensis]HQE57122.1 hypothetical protein [Candidatus Fermentibacter daniensis]